MLTQPPPANELLWPDASADELAFMRRVYDLHVAKSRERRPFVGDVPITELEIVENGVPLRAEAALACRALLAAAREALAQAQTAGDPAAKATRSIAAVSGYRSATRQFELWQRNFPRYFAHTEDARAAAPGGPFGEEAEKIAYARVANLLAAPGFSLHNDGRAIDFGTNASGRDLGPSSAQREHWRRAWLFGWLMANAGPYGFVQNLKIDEPWHWEYRRG